MKTLLHFLMNTKLRLLALPILLLLSVFSFAQTEDFEDETVSMTTFTIDGVLFNMSGDLRVSQFDNFSCGGTNAGANKYMDTGYQDGGTGAMVGSFAPADNCATFQLNTVSNAQWGWTGTNDGENQVLGTIRFTGTKTDQTTISQEITLNPTNTSALVPFTFSSSIWGNVELVAMQIEIVNTPTCDYFAMDELIFSNVSANGASFTALADLCADASTQIGLGGGLPTGGVYSGPGVTDDGNGLSYSFDPATAGVGSHTISYTYTGGNGCMGSASDQVTVSMVPTVAFTAPANRM